MPLLAASPKKRLKCWAFKLAKGLEYGAKDLIEAELTQERFRELPISQGQDVFVYLRNVRVFLNS